MSSTLIPPVSVQSPGSARPESSTPPTNRALNETQSKTHEQKAKLNSENAHLLSWFEKPLPEKVTKQEIIKDLELFQKFINSTANNRSKIEQSECHNRFQLQLQNAYAQRKAEIKRLEEEANKKIEQELMNDTNDLPEAKLKEKIAELQRTLQHVIEYHTSLDQFHKNIDNAITDFHKITDKITHLYRDYNTIELTSLAGQIYEISFQLSNLYTVLAPRLCFADLSKQVTTNDKLLTKQLIVNAGKFLDANPETVEKLFNPECQVFRTQWDSVHAELRTIQDHVLKKCQITKDQKELLSQAIINADPYLTQPKHSEIKAILELGTENNTFASQLSDWVRAERLLRIKPNELEKVSWPNLAKTHSQVRTEGCTLTVENKQVVILSLESLSDRQDDLRTRLTKEKEILDKKIELPRSLEFLAPKVAERRTALATEITNWQAQEKKAWDDGLNTEFNYFGIEIDQQSTIYKGSYPGMGWLVETFNTIYAKWKPKTENIVRTVSPTDASFKPSEAIDLSEEIAERARKIAAEKV